MTDEELLKKYGGRKMTAEEEKEAEALSKQFHASKLFHEKMKGFAVFLMYQMKVEHPDWSLNQMLVFILGGSDSNLPPSVLLAMTQAIVEEWVEAEIEEPVLA